MEGVDGSDQLTELSLVTLLDTDQGHSGGALLVHELAETGLVLDHSERDTHLAAEGGEPHNNLDRVNIMGDEDELSLALLNKGSDVVQAKLGGERRAGRLNLLTGSLLLGGGAKTSLTLLGGLRAVLITELESTGSDGLVNSVVELVDGNRDLEALQEHTLLTLKLDVARPAHETCEIALRLDITANVEGARSSLNDRQSLLFVLLAGGLAVGSLSLGDIVGGRSRGLSSALLLRL
mmetsp:Transcript_33515/g.84130  ORF Transcript_33515/g.84130 Transcript_33515/m.84130 type:complete len:236 (-) Transcript_33515:19-726(-)